MTAVPAPPAGDVSRALLAGDPATVARHLLGAVIAGRDVRLRVTEVEAYRGEGEDPASHAHRGPTPRARVMFGAPGHLYVYLSYGMHLCLNVVTCPDGTAGAVLLRAGEVVAGEEVAWRRNPACRGRRDLARGPARLARTLGAARDDNGSDLLDPAAPIRLLAVGAHPGPAQLATGPRVGVSHGAEEPLRFWLRGEETVSGYRRSPRAPAAGGGS